MKPVNANPNQSQADNMAITQQGTAALKRLAALADKAENDDSRHHAIKRFLLSLYNGESYPLDPDILRGLNQDNFDDCIRVLTLKTRVNRFDSRKNQIHNYLEDGFNRFERWGQASKPYQAKCVGVSFR